MGNILALLAFVLGVLLTVFALQNTDSTRVDFLNFDTGRVPLALVIFTSALVGAALASLLWVRERVRHTLDVRRRDKRLRELEAEVNGLRGRAGATTGSATLGPAAGPDAASTGTSVDYTAGT